MQRANQFPLSDLNNDVIVAITRTLDLSSLANLLFTSKHFYALGKSEDFFRAWRSIKNTDNEFKTIFEKINVILADYEITIGDLSSVIDFCSVVKNQDKLDKMGELIKQHDTRLIDLNFASRAICGDGYLSRICSSIMYAAVGGCAGSTLGFLFQISMQRIVSDDAMMVVSFGLPAAGVICPLAYPIYMEIKKCFYDNKKSTYANTLSSLLTKNIDVSNDTTTPLLSSSAKKSVSNFQSTTSQLRQHSTYKAESPRVEELADVVVDLDQGMALV